MRLLAARFAHERPYAFCLLTPADSDSGPWFASALATERGLEEVVQHYLDRGYSSERGDARALLNDMLRWANPDDGWRYDFESFEQVIAIASSTVEVRDWELVCEEALRHVDGRRGFELLAPRPKLTLGVTYGENPEDFLESTANLNPPALAEQAAAEWQRARQAWSALRPPPTPMPIALLQGSWRH